MDRFRLLGLNLSSLGLRVDVQTSYDWVWAVQHSLLGLRRNRFRLLGLNLSSLGLNFRVVRLICANQLPLGLGGPTLALGLEEAQQSLHKLEHFKPWLSLH